MPRKASARKTSAKTTSAKKTATQQDSASRGSQSFKMPEHIDPNSTQGRRITELNRQLQQEVATAPATAKPNFGASEMKLGGVTKVLREAGDENTGKPNPTHIVQQGGGGAVDGATGQPLR